MVEKVSFIKKLFYFAGLRDLNDKVSLDFYPNIRSILCFAYCIGLFLFSEILLDKVPIYYRVLLVIGFLYFSVEVCYKITIYFYKKRKE